MLSAAIAFYSPTLFSYFSAHPPPIFVKAEKSANMPFDMVVPSDRTSVPPPPGCDGFHAWGLQQGGVDAGQTNVSLIVQGNTDANVYISGIHASLTSREPLSQGAHVNCQSEGRIDPQPVEIDLARSDQAFVVEGQNAPFGFTVSKTDTMVFDVAVKAISSRYAYRLVVEAIVDGDSETFEVDDAGEPFAVTGDPTSGRYYSWGVSGGWVKNDSGDAPEVVPAGAVLTS